MPAPTLTTQQIGRLGELLVQFELLRYGIESAPLTTDAGIDLVAYSPARTRAHTIQVKTNLAPKPSGGKGPPSFDWWVPDDCPAELFALVELATRRIWLFNRDELHANAQQRSSGRCHLYVHAGPHARHGAHRLAQFLFENRLAELFL